MVRHDIEGRHALRRGGGRRRRRHLRREQQADPAGSSAGPGTGRATATTTVTAAASVTAVTAPARSARAWPVSVSVCHSSRATGSMPVRAIGSASSWKAVASSRCSSSSVSMLFPSSSCYCPVPRRPDEPGPRGTRRAHGGYGTSPCLPCIRAPPLSPPPTGLPRTAVRHGPLLQRQPPALSQEQTASSTAAAASHRRRQRCQVRDSSPHRGAAGSATDPDQVDQDILLQAAGDCPATDKRPAVRNRACWTRSSASCRLPTSRKAKLRAAPRPGPRTPRTPLHPRWPASGSLFVASHRIKRHPSRSGCQRTAQTSRRADLSARLGIQRMRQAITNETP